MEYVIAKIEPKFEYVRNKYYPMLIGRECDILFLMVQHGAVLLVDMPYDPDHPHHFYTTPVEDIRPQEDGGVIFVTENSTYTLVPNVRESKCTK